MPSFPRFDVRFMGPKIASLAVVMMLLIVAFPLPEAVTGQTTPQSNLIVDEFEDDLAEHDLAFPGPGFNDQTALVLPNHAFVDTATINMSFGTFPGSRSAPWDPSLDIGDDGVWDVWQVEGPNMIWYFRGAPHVHTWVYIRA